MGLASGHSGCVKIEGGGGGEDGAMFHCSLSIELEESIREDDLQKRLFSELMAKFI